MTREPRKIGAGDEEERLDENQSEEQEIMTREDVPEDFPSPEENHDDIVSRAFRSAYTSNIPLEDPEPFVEDVKKPLPNVIPMNWGNGGGKPPRISTINDEFFGDEEDGDIIDYSNITTEMMYKECLVELGIILVDMNDKEPGAYALDIGALSGMMNTLIAAMGHEESVKARNVQSSGIDRGREKLNK